MRYFILLLLTISMIQITAHHKNDATINEKQEESQVPLTEDLMYEHGILNRVLLIYEEIIKRIDGNIDFQITTLADALDIIKSFIEDFHEKVEETYIFPLFEKNKKELKLVATLKNQHDKGRQITTKLQNLCATQRLDDTSKRIIKYLLKKFIRMYRPHEARENTVLFPQVRTLLSEQEFKDLGEKIEDLEHEFFGPQSFQDLLKKVEELEKDLNIYNLEQFTPNMV